MLLLKYNIHMYNINIIATIIIIYLFILTILYYVTLSVRRHSSMNYGECAL